MGYERKSNTKIPDEWFAEAQLKELKSQTDWSSFRREAAKGAMCQLIGMGRDDGYKYSPEEVAHYAIVYADALIAKLKEK